MSKQYRDESPRMARPCWGIGATGKGDGEKNAGEGEAKVKTERRQRTPEATRRWMEAPCKPASTRRTPSLGGGAASGPGCGSKSHPVGRARCAPFPPLSHVHSVIEPLCTLLVQQQRHMTGLMQSCKVVTESLQSKVGHLDTHVMSLSHVNQSRQLQVQHQSHSSPNLMHN